MIGTDDMNNRERSDVNLLLGGTGFLGTALASTLVARGEPVVSVSRSGQGRVAGVTEQVLDLGRQDIPETLLRRARSIYLLVGQIRPDFAAEEERQLLLRILEQLRHSSGRVFFCSSTLVYGHCSAPASELTPPHPIGEYPRFKWASEQLVSEFLGKERGVVVRLGNVYGTPQNRGFVGLAVEAALSLARPPLAIHGSGQQRRDYIFIDDVVGAMVAVRDHAEVRGTVNIATGTSYTLLELLDVLSRVTGQPVRSVREAPHTGDPAAILVDNHRLQAECGYRTFVPLDEGLRQTVARYQKEAMV